MQRHDINLIRDRVPSRRRRFVLYWLMNLYIAITGLGLVFAAAISTRQFQDASLLRRELRLVRKAFQHETGSDQDPREFAASMRTQLETTRQTVATLETLLQDRANMPRILLGLFTPLPSGFRIDDINIRHDNHTLQFNLLVPTDLPDTNQRITRLIHDWNNSSGLQTEVDTLQNVSRSRETGSNSGLLQLQIVGHLKGKG